MISKIIETSSMDELIKLFGPFDENIKAISAALDVRFILQDGQCSVYGEEHSVNKAMAVIDKLKSFIYNGDSADIGRVNYLLDCVREDKLDEVDELLGEMVAITNRGKPIKCKTVGQKAYVDAIRKDTVVFGVGPAGTGKTYLAVCLAVQAMKQKQVEKIILTRPAVEAGEKLGFLPGDLQTKVDPYLRPLYDALQEMLGVESYTKLMERGAIEIAPLAYMRGRTLSNAFIILDEAQNTTKEQMKMFLTRLGDGSKMVITGDASQIDLPEGKKSGLIHATALLKEVEGISVINLTDKDVVRNTLVMRIVRAYDKENKQ